MAFALLLRTGEFPISRWSVRVTKHHSKPPTAKRHGIVSLVRDSARDFSDDECPVRAAALAYYTIFALPPLLILLLMIAGLVWDPQDVQRALEGQFRSLIGEQGAAQIHTMIAQTDRPDKGGALATMLSIAGLLFGATGALLQLQGALNRAWEVKPDPKQGGIMAFITKRLLSLGMLLGIGFLLAVSLALTAGVAALGDAVGGGIPEPVMYVVELGMSFAVLMLLFAAIFKILPDAETAWRDVWVGAGVTALLFVVGKFVLGLYLGRGDKGDPFGAAGALAVVLIWIYYAGMILLFGAEFTQKWAERRGGGVRPEKGAVHVVEEERIVSREQAPRSVRGGKPSRSAPARRQGDVAAMRPANQEAGKGGMLLGLGLLLLRLRGRRITRTS